MQALAYVVGKTRAYKHYARVGGEFYIAVIGGKVYDGSKIHSYIDMQVGGVFFMFIVAIPAYSQKYVFLWQVM